ncbi:MAG: metal ABC transporter permease [Planctomycetota bacterium]
MSLGTVFSEPFIQTALAIGILTGGLCAYLGNFILLKNMSFLSIALSEVSALGIATGFFLQYQFAAFLPEHLAHSTNIVPNLSALFFTLSATLFFWFQSKKTQRFMNEGMIAFIYAGSAALTIILISANPFLESRGSGELLNGNLLFCSAEDLSLICWTVFGIGIVHFIGFRNFLFVSLDRETAYAQGVKADFWEFLLLFTIGICISFSMRLTGVLFVFSSLIIPGLTGLTLFSRVKWIFCFSVFLVAISVVLGIIASWEYNLPTSPAIICFYVLFFILAQILRKIRG